MPNPDATTIRRLVIVRPTHAEDRGVRRLLLARHGDTLLPAHRRTAPARGGREP